MLLGDLVYNDGFDVNCNYAVYGVDCEENKAGWDWLENSVCLWSTLINGYYKPPCALLDKTIRYITWDSASNALVIEVN